MESKSPRAGLNNPVQRGISKVEAALEWIHPWHYATTAIIAEHLKISRTNASNLLGRLVKQGVLRRIDCDELQGADLFMLTPDGVEEAQLLGVQVWDYDTRPSSINHEKIRHDVGVQWITSCTIQSLEDKGVRVTKIEPDHILRDGSPGKLPDAVLTLEAGPRISIEFERSEKTGERLDRFLASIADDLADGRYAKTIVASRVPGLVENYKARLSGTIMLYEKNHISHRWETRGTVTICPEIADRISLRHYPELAAILSPVTWRRRNLSGAPK